MYIGGSGWRESQGEFNLSEVDLSSGLDSTCQTLGETPTEAREKWMNSQEMPVELEFPRSDYSNPGKWVIQDLEAMFAVICFWPKPGWG